MSGQLTMMQFREEVDAYLDFTNPQTVVLLLLLVKTFIDPLSFVRGINWWLMRKCIG
jgi:hypothetical protein